jgi:Ca2+/H+ antiporter
VVLRHSLLTLTFEQNLTRRSRAALQLLILLDLVASAVTSEGVLNQRQRIAALTRMADQVIDNVAATVGERASLLSALTGYPAGSLVQVRFGWLLPLITLVSLT